ncbi:histidine kinase, partial [Crocosphaera sp. Alani8]
MSKLVVLKLGKGNWQEGFSNVNIQVSEPNHPISLQLSGSLPPDTKLWDDYQKWQNLYEALSENLILRRYRGSGSPMIEFDTEEVTNISDGEFLYLCEQLETQLNQWLSTESFSRIERQLRSHVNVSDEIRLIIETENEELRRFPWHLWHFFEDYPFVEVALSPAEYGRVSTVSMQRDGKVRILAILGNSQGIDVEKDRTLLEQLPDGEVIFLVEPQRQDLDRWLWDEQGWDILFFAGHSFSHSQGMTGQLEINSQESLSLSQLRNALKTAIRQGLNSDLAPDETKFQTMFIK